MAKSSSNLFPQPKDLTIEDLVDNGIQQIIKAFGKGQDLRGAVWSIVAGSANWGADNIRRTQEKKAD